MIQFWFSVKFQSLNSPRKYALCRTAKTRISQFIICTAVLVQNFQTICLITGAKSALSNAAATVLQDICFDHRDFYAKNLNSLFQWLIIILNIESSEIYFCLL